MPKKTDIVQKFLNIEHRGTFWKDQHLAGDIEIEFFNKLVQNYEGDYIRAKEKMDELRKRGDLHLILKANKFDIRQMVADRKAFVA